MKMLFFGRNDRNARMAQLYRASEEGGGIPSADSDLCSALEADQRVMRAMGDLASRSEPASPAIGRAKLLAAVAARNSQSPEETGPRSMFEKLLTGRALALLAAAGIFAGAATVAAAAGGGVPDYISGVLSSAHITSSSSHATATPTGDAALSVDVTETPGAEPTHATGAPHACTPTATTTATNTPTATDTPTATETPTATTTVTPEGSHAGNGPRNNDCDVRGIPTTNSHFTPEANGTCEPGESAVKTVPSGIQVQVPCQALDHPGKPGESTPASGAETPAATNADTPNGNKGGESGDHGQAGDHIP